MRKLLKWTGVGLLASLAALLLLVLAWMASNWGDADPQPIPAALVAPAASSGEGGLLAALADVPKATEFLAWPSCKGSDCRAAFEAKTAAWMRWQAANAGMGAACQAALQAPQLSLGEPLPASWSPATELPAYQRLSQCHGLLLNEGWLAGQGGDAQGMLTALQLATRLEHLLRDGSQLLVGQMVGVGMASRKLTLITALAPQFPAQRQALAELADLPAPALMAAMRRWVPAEAAFGRGAVALLQEDPTALTMGAALDGQPPSWYSRWMGRLSARFAQPEFTRQLFDGMWLRTLECLNSEVPQQAADCWRASTQAAQGALPGGMRWRHTVPYVLYEVALPAWPTYIDRAVDLHHATQATQAWLRGQAPTTAIEVAADGTWTLRLRAPEQAGRLPSQWTPLPQDR